MGQLVFQATLGGQVNLVGPNTASTFNLNVPAVSSTLATLAAQTFTGTQTMTTLTSPAATNFTLQSAGTTAVTIDTSQNVGIGTATITSKLTVYGTGDQKLSLVSPSGSSTQVGINLSPSMLASESAANPAQAAIYATDSNYSANIIFANKTAGALANSLTERMRIDSSGNVGIGVTPSAWSSGGQIDLGSDKAISSSDPYLSVGTNFYYSGGYKYKSTGASTYLYQNAGAFKFYQAASGSAGSAISFTQAMTLDSSGNLLVGTTTQFNANSKVNIVTTSSSFDAALTCVTNYTSDVGNAALWVVKKDNVTTTSQVFVRFGINGAGAASGQINANGASSAAFGSYSDSRLKENITNLPSQLANIMALRPVEFDYIESEGGGHQIGFIAQEVKEIYPDLIGERADGMFTLTDLNKNDARLIKAIQELKAINDTQAETLTQQTEAINALTARVVALEAK